MTAIDTVSRDITRSEDAASTNREEEREVVTGVGRKGGWEVEKRVGGREKREVGWA